MNICTNCGKSNEVYERFCQECGYPLPVTVHEDSSDAILEGDLSTQEAAGGRMLKSRLKPIHQFNRRYLLILFPLLIIPVLIFVCFNIGTNTSDNFLDNRLNGGQATIQGKWIYYSAGGGLYKMDNKNGKSEKIADGSYSDITVFGDWIYLRDINMFMSSGVANNIYRIKTDGSGKTTTPSMPIGAIADDIYFHNNIDNTLFKTSKDGKEVNMPIDKDDIPLAVIDKKIYTWSITGLDSTANNITMHLYQYDCNGKNKNGIFSQTISTGRMNFHIENNVLYYFAPAASGEKDFITSCNLENLSKTTLSNSSADAFNVSNGWIYYISDNSIFKMRLNGDDKAKIFKVPDSLNSSSNNIFLQNLCVTGNWIFFSDISNLYRIKTDGSGFQNIGAFMSPIAISDSSTFK